MVDVPGEEPWPRLHDEAVAAMQRAYAPYSDYQVGAAALVDDGRVVVGCNVENASYGVGLCAECGLVSQLHASGGGRLTHFVCVNRDAEVIMPCGRCRQLLFEAGGPDAPAARPSPGCGRWPRCCPTRSAPSRSMRSTSLDLTDPQVVADPYPFFAEERRRGPLAWHEQSGGYLTFDHADGERGAARPAPRAAVARPASRRRGSSRSTCCTATR